MYILLLVVLLAAGVAVLSHGAKRRQWWECGLGILLLVGTPVLFGSLSLWGELLWFRALGFRERFWTVIGARLGCTTAGVVFGATITWSLTLLLPTNRKSARYLPLAAGAVVGGLWGLANWTEILRFWYAVPSGTVDPIFGHDVSFYLFTLPLLNRFGWLLILLVLISLTTAVVVLLQSRRIRFRDQSAAAPDNREPIADFSPRSLLPLQVIGGAFLIVLGWNRYLAVFDLMYSRQGVVYGPGWTDVHVRLPAYLLVAALWAIAGLTLVGEAALRRWRETTASRGRLWLTASPLAAAALCWLVGLILLPGLFQWIYVQPNEVSVERPYIEHNIRFTRQAFQLDQIEEQQFPVSGEFARPTSERNRKVLSQVRLWDPRALDAVYQQFQEIRLYYEFHDVDIDRYSIDGQYQQVMISPREVALENLPRESQTFVNRRFKYTHGYGLTMAPVNEFTQGGLPNLLIKDLPPKTTSPELTVRRPEIYYGELTDTHVIVNTQEKEFDYPSGEHNVYTKYSGTGGVALSSWLRKFAFGWKFDGTRLFVSSYPTAESRILFHRQIHDRLHTLAPFLHFDEDPYIVLDEGRLYWIVDGYTTSDYFPYSRPFLSRETTSYQRDQREQSLRTEAATYLHGANYLRNSVKAVIDAFEGTVSFYVFDPEDPLIQVWQKIFPGLFKSRDELRPSIRAHVRYPEGLLLVQGMMYARYHMTDPEVFYNQEDVWVRATEKYYSNVQQVEPYYVMWQPPHKQKQMRDGKGRVGDPEFILMQPYTPKNRQVLIGWIAGMCDGENYGRLLSYRFPKDTRVLGTQQVETKIDQDSYLSKQLSLWDQRGSRVVRGNVLVIPVDDTLLYVEPIYLQAEAAAYPELRLVAVMHNDRLSYADNFKEALEGLYLDGEPTPPAGEPATVDRTAADLAQRASDAFDRYLEALSDKRFDSANRHLKTLSETLKQLSAATSGDDEATTVADEEAADGIQR